MKGDSSVSVSERFEEAELEAPALGPPLGQLKAAAAVLAAALLGLFWAVVRPAVGAGLLVSGFAMVVGALAAAHLARRAPPKPGARRGLALRERALLFDPGGHGGRPSVVATLGGPFGLTLIANRARTRVALVLTTETATFYVGAVIDEAERAVQRALLASAYTVASDERALDAAAPDGSPLLLPAETLERLHRALAALDPRSTRRVFLTDARGEAVVLDGPTLTVGRRALDLDENLEWYGLLFRESGLGGVAVYQGTHVRQGGTEVVFVSLMPALSAPSSPGDMISTAEPLLERAVLRDMALLHETAEDPPPAELRVAIERVFMLPLRAALNATRQRIPAPLAPVRRQPPLGASLEQFLKGTALVCLVNLERLLKRPHHPVAMKLAQTEPV